MKVTVNAESRKYSFSSTPSVVRFEPESSVDFESSDEAVRYMQEDLHRHVEKAELENYKIKCFLLPIDWYVFLSAALDIQKTGAKSWKFARMPRGLKFMDYECHVLPYRAYGQQHPFMVLDPESSLHRAIVEEGLK